MVLRQVVSLTEDSEPGMNLHLFCLPGLRDIGYILDSARPYLAAQAEPVVAYLPAAAVDDNWLDYTRKAFAGLAKVDYIDAEVMTVAEFAAVLDRAGAIYVSGGNTFLLTHRLHRSGFYPLLRQKTLDGLPLIGFSAGTTLCGPNILTSNDLNLCATTHFEGLNLTPYNFSVHYPADETLRDAWDEWLQQYHVYFSNSILALEDDAYLRIDDTGAVLVRGGGWLLAKGQARRQIQPGTVVTIA